MSGKARNPIDDLFADIRRSSVIDASTWASLQQVYGDKEFVRWADGLAQLLVEKIGYSAVLDFSRASVALARKFGPAASLNLAPRVRAIRQASGEKAAASFLSAASTVAIHLADAEALVLWLSTMEDVAKLAPESLSALCRRLSFILPKLDAKGFHAWAHAGFRSAGDDPGARLAYFDLKDQSALRAFEQASSDVLFVDIEPRVVAFVGALWNFRPAVRTMAIRPGQPAPRRAAFDGAIVWMPEAYPGRFGQDAITHYQSVIAHIGAHAAYSKGRFPRGSLKALQISLVSLLEDARVENLAMRDFPGLRRLWGRYHNAQPGTAVSAELLMPRLARALIDPDYRDDNPWVVKGRSMFFDSQLDWENPQISRTIGGLLGNDLGQMRIQFNAKTYVVEPSYRDDHSGIWEADDLPPEEAPAAEVILSAARIERQETDEPKSKHEKADDAPLSNIAAALSDAEDQDGLPIARHSEWDYLQVALLREWTTINEYLARPASLESAREMAENTGGISARISRLVKSAKISRPEWRGRQFQGERLDLDACIRSAIDLASGDTPDPRVYQTRVLKNRDLSVSVLLDISESTRDRIKDTNRTVLSVARTATSLLAEAMSGLGDPFAICGFCSDGRDDVRYYRVKDFDQPFDEAARRRLAGLRGRLSTRLGAALRQAGGELKNQHTHRRLVLVITDGDPSDVDVGDTKYLVEDARRAVHDLSNKGIDVLCIGLQRDGDAALQRIFGRRGFVLIDRVEALVEKLPLIYMRMTT